MKRDIENAENHHFLGSISTQSIRNLFPRSASHKLKMKSSLSISKFGGENTPPPDPNVQHIITGPTSPVVAKKPLSKSVVFQKESSRSGGQEEEIVPSDPSVKVVVRIRADTGQEKQETSTIRRVSSKSLSVGDRLFSFDAVVDSSSSQEEFFKLVGVPLVKNSLAGFNTSILSYGQTASGKTYTMWGPPSAMVEGHSSSSHQGIVPRVFQMLFSEIHREQENSEKQINYQCRCSFLEIYNDQIGDLLDPTQRNLAIRDDAKNGFYVENLTEEYVTSYKDITQILIKGLSNRKVGATSINSKGSRSHIVFTCVIESWSKGTSSKCFGSSKTSRISLIDLAGSERNKLDDAGRQYVKEGKHVKKSLSHLGKLVNILAEGAQSGESKNIPYRNSCLTHLLRESLGGNTKLTVICSISPDDRCRVETLSTLRFGQRAKAIQNMPVINEITEDDVNGLSDQIRQLKEELIKAKSDVHCSIGTKSGYYKGQNARDSLNQLRLSLNRSLILPRIDSDIEDDINVDEEDVRELRDQLDNVHSSCKNNSREPPDDKDCIQFSTLEQSSEPDIELDTGALLEESNIEEPHLRKFERELPSTENDGHVENLLACPDTATTTNSAIRSSLSIRPGRQSPVLEGPTLSESPKIADTLKKSIPTSSNLFASQNCGSENPKFDQEVQRQSLKVGDHRHSSLRSSKIFAGPTESLAASLQRGLQIIDYHQRSSASNKSSVALSFEHLTLKPFQAVEKDDAGIQTEPEVQKLDTQKSASFLCTSCKRMGFSGSNQVQDSFNTWIVPFNGAVIPEGPKDAEKLLEEARKREKDLESLCAEQAAKIDQLNCLVEQSRYERENNSIVQQNQEIETCQIKALTNEIVPSEELKTGYSSLEDKNKEELDPEYRNTFSNTSEREVLLKQIQSLRSKLQLYMDAAASIESTEKQNSFHSLSRSIHLSRSVDTQDKSEEDIEKERQRWTEMESEWISLTDELRIDLQANRQHAEKVEAELRMEKNCTQELDDALNRAVLGHARIIEHYAELQEKYNDLLEKHKRIMEGIAEVKRAAAKAGGKGNSRFVKSLAAELSALRVEREREREQLKKENKSLRIQLRDTAEAVHAAGELLVRLREAEEAASIAEENSTTAQQEIEKLKKQMEKLKRKHKMEMVTMKQYLAESRLPESALRPLYHQDSDVADHCSTTAFLNDDQAWRAEFGPIYQDCRDLQ
ncbi:kinesin-like protein KIN-12F isoform X2 [Telopea speciosissima]|uniref:kinesin-like protein KIN-12F isoform X2 n=1 Tax=Telopea speciosissima TaxID=54955 RepID=UPI001CC486A9|nr:kinesin-like protein KIN-12F isoform X2 [Telopea speciosissima]